MLAVTENAVEIIRDLTSQDSVPEGSGLRIASDREAGALTLSLVPGPEAGDHVVDAAGARVFLDTDAAMLLGDKALDVAVDDAGDVAFAVSDQPG